MDEKTYVPSLTLNPTQAAAQEAPAAPQLVVEEEKPAVEPEKLDIDRLSPEEQAQAGVSPEMVRLSVGLEHVEDLKAELKEALA